MKGERLLHPAHEKRQAAGDRSRMPDVESAHEKPRAPDCDARGCRLIPALPRRTAN
jgi:hypothetical protein